MTQTYKDSFDAMQPRVACCVDLSTLMPERFFKALGDGNRIALLARLAEKGSPCTVTEAAGCCTVDLSVVSRHLATLREAGILEAEKRGRQVYYSVPFSSLARTLRSIADAIDACCPSATAGAKPENKEIDHDKSS